MRIRRSALSQFAVLAIGCPMLAACAGHQPASMKLGLASAESAASEMERKESRGRSLFLASLSTPLTSEDETAKLSPRVVEPGQPVPRGGGVRKLGAPYVAAGRTVTPQHDPEYDRAGIASWYGELFHGRKTANGEVYDMDALSAAHPTLPLPSYVKVTHLGNGRTLILRVNDRGPFAHDRIIDLSRRAAKLLGIKRGGTGPVRVTYLKPAPLDGDDSYETAFLAAQPWHGKPATRIGLAERTAEPGATSGAQMPEDG